MKAEDLTTVFRELETAERISVDRSFQLSRLANSLVHDLETERLGRELVIRVLDAWKRVDETTYPIWNDLVEAVGLYPYVRADTLKGPSRVRLEMHRSKYLPEVLLHSEQLELSMVLEMSKPLILSAPTSFGKSLLIEEVVASRRYQNIVVIQPTLALLDETRKKLRKYADTYNIIVSTSQEPTTGRNLFLFTGERVVEYRDFSKVDFFVIDEFYKLSLERDDERAAVLNCAFVKLLKLTRAFYLLGPNISSIPRGFDAAYSALFHNSKFSTVAVDVSDVPSDAPGGTKETQLFSLLQSLDSQTLIYCSSPDKANTLAYQFAEYRAGLKSMPEITGGLANLDILEWIDQNIHHKWRLKETLLSSVGVHHGQLPRHLGSTMVDYFNKEAIRYLFCTSTLIEGVNTSAKNVVLFDKTKGRTPIDFFDYKNITGRSGRMKKHFIGKVYRFHPQPTQMELELDIPFFTEAHAPAELLIQMSPEDIKNKNSPEVKKIEALQPEVRELIKSNKGISVDGQIALLEKLTREFDNLYPGLAWSRIPNYVQLETVLGLAWSALLKPKEPKGGVVNHRQLATLALQYVQAKSLRDFIAGQVNSAFMLKKYPEEVERIEECVSKSLQVCRNWFEYKLPKWLGTMSSLQAYVCGLKGRVAGNYNFFAGELQNETLPPSLAILLEYGVPHSAIRKLKGHVPKEIGEKQLLGLLKKLDLSRLGLLGYEINRIEAAL